jgi:amino acid transporter
MALCYLFFSYATVVAFNYDVKTLSSADVPFLTAAQQMSGILALLVYIAGFTSTMGAMIAGTNSQARLIFNAAREGLLPHGLTKLHPKTHTPWISLFVFSAIGLGIVYLFGWNLPPVTFFGEVSTLGTILIAVTYLVSNLALPVYYRRYHPDQFSLVKHLVLPILGIFAIGFPLWALVGPGQPAPFSFFPWISLAIIVVALIYAVILSQRDPQLGDRVGSIIADRE